MERRRNLFAEKLCFWFVITQLAMLTKSEIVTEHNLTTTIQMEDTEFAWSAWGSWSECSRTCGGGVAVQTRQCLPRSHTSGNNTSTASVARVATHAHDCLGLSKRYHECNTKPCRGEQGDARAVQCSSYDKRPFRGRFYTWVPYIDGEAPCTLHCRPLGEVFYAALALARDGTPCSAPAGAARCLRGHCAVSALVLWTIYLGHF